MTALRLPGTAASKNVFSTQSCGGTLIFLSFAGVNILTNQYKKAPFIPLDRP